MGLFKKTEKNVLNEKDPPNEFELFFEWILGEKSKQLHIKKLAIEHAVDMIARTIAKCEIQYYKYDPKKKKVERSFDNETYYKLNIKPNKNETASSFFYMVYCSLIKENKALLVTIDNLLYFSDSWVEDQSIITEKKYTSIRLRNTKGDTFTLNKSFPESDVINLRIGNSKIKNILDQYFNEYEKLLNISFKHYQSQNINKWRLKINGGQPTLQDPVTKEEISYEEYKNKMTRGLFSEEEEVILLSDKFGIEKLGAEKELSSEDYRNMVKKWSDDVAMEFNIPLDVFYGTKTDKSTGTNDFITLAVAPVIKIIEDNLNAKLIEKSKYLKGERLIINKLNIKHFDIFDVAGPIDKLSANGFSHNDNREFLNLPTVDEDWANEHRFTKNYGDVKGGD